MRASRRAPKLWASFGGASSGRGAAILIALALGAPTPVLAGAAGTLTGSVTLGRPPLRVPAHVSHDRTVCGLDEPVYQQLTELGPAGGLKDVLVFVETATPATSLGAIKPAPKKERPAPVEIDQRNCAFVPRVAGARVGAKLVLKNSDPVLHNVHVYRGAKETVLNYAMPIQGQQIQAGTMSKPGMYTFRCDAGHVWMSASLWVFPHSFFSVTGANGTYAIEGLPKGRHKLVAWHPDLGRIERWIELTGDNPVSGVDLRF